jgi:hypothetical protein
VHGMVYRIIHEGPFRLQPEEIVRGEFMSMDAVVERVTREAFCPDGLAVLQAYLAQSRRDAEEFKSKN